MYDTHNNNNMFLVIKSAMVFKTDVSVTPAQYQHSIKQPVFIYSWCLLAHWVEIN